MKLKTYQTKLRADNRTQMIRRKRIEGLYDSPAVGRPDVSEVFKTLAEVLVPDFLVFDQNLPLNKQVLLKKNLIQQLREQVAPRDRTFCLIKVVETGVLGLLEAILKLDLPACPSGQLQLKLEAVWLIQNLSIIASTTEKVFIQIINVLLELLTIEPSDSDLASLLILKDASIQAVSSLAWDSCMLSKEVKTHPNFVEFVRLMYLKRTSLSFSCLYALNNFIQFDSSFATELLAMELGKALQTVSNCYRPGRKLTNEQNRLI